MFIDSHCHIHAEDFAADREEVIVRAQEQGVDYMLDVCDELSVVENIVHMCEKYQNVYTSIGVHPEYAEKYSELKPEDLLVYTSNRYIVGLGECGLDYHYNRSTRLQQIKVLQSHITAAQISGLPLIIHSREADDDMIELLQKNYIDRPFRGELHCFSSSARLCAAALELGFYISASGILTFKGSTGLCEIFKTIPANRLLIETDSPYLAPIPHRGKRNEPAFVVETARVLAKLKEMRLEELAKVTSDNFFRLFDKIKISL